MTQDARLSRFGETVDEWIERLPALLDDEPVGMWVIVPTGRDDFELEQGELTAFVKRALDRLLEVGARPVRRDIAGPHYWAIQTQYGNTADEIVRNVIGEWLRNEDGEPWFAGPWFASPSDCGIRNLPMDEWFEQLPLQLEKGSFAMSQIVLAGEFDYGLKGDDLAEFIGKAVRLLLERGALPSRRDLEADREQVDNRFGESTDEIPVNIVAAWKASDDRLMVGLCFGIFEAKKIA